jgi:hypothetical protein
MSNNKKTSKQTSTNKESKSKAVYPDKNADTSGAAPNSNSDGNVTSARGREKTRTTHTKTFTSGTDSDGQAD